MIPWPSHLPHTFTLYTIAERPARAPHQIQLIAINYPKYTKHRPHPVAEVDGDRSHIIA